MTATKIRQGYGSAEPGDNEFVHAVDPTQAEPHGMCGLLLARVDEGVAWADSAAEPCPECERLAGDGQRPAVSSQRTDQPVPATGTVPQGHADPEYDQPDDNPLTAADDDD